MTSKATLRLNAKDGGGFAFDTVKQSIGSFSWLFGNILFPLYKSEKHDKKEPFIVCFTSHFVDGGCAILSV